MVKNSTSIDEINSRVINCKLCSLSLTRKNAVPGMGYKNSKIFIVGEGPGKNEDERGIPFVGSAGKILNEALYQSGIQRKDVYITNIVKCRPPNNRVPFISEINTCTTEYLQQEFKIISPSVICILGATALKTLLNLKNITSYRGRLIVRNSFNYFITYHPAAIIYNNKLKEIFFNDIKKLSYMMRTENI